MTSMSIFMVLDRIGPQKRKCEILRVARSPGHVRLLLVVDASVVFWPQNVRPGIAGLLIDIEYSRVRDSS